jgi:hypothetical protein
MVECKVLMVLLTTYNTRAASAATCIVPAVCLCVLRLADVYANAEKMNTLRDSDA